MDTAGASGWFRPTAAITSITLTFSALSGIPSFQLWASALISDISATVELESGGPVPSGTTLRLLDADGAEVATTAVGAGGTYSFLEVVAAEYSVQVVPPDDSQVIGPGELPADTPTELEHSGSRSREADPTTLARLPHRRSTEAPPPVGGGGSSVLAWWRSSLVACWAATSG